MTPGAYNLTVLRNAPYLPGTIDFEGFDFTGATFALEVRTNRAAAGAALLTLVGAAAGSQGVSVTTSVTEGVTTSHVQLQIDEATIDAILPWPANGQKAGTDVVLHYDLVITGGGVGKVRWLEGTFTIREGVTV